VVGVLSKGKVGIGRKGWGWRRDWGGVGWGVRIATVRIMSADR